MTGEPIERFGPILADIGGLLEEDILERRGRPACLGMARGDQRDALRTEIAVVDRVRLARERVDMQRARAVCYRTCAGA